MTDHAYRDEPASRQRPADDALAGSPGRICLITGATSGIGEATARLLGASGYRLALNARSADTLDALATDLSTGGRDVSGSTGAAAQPAKWPVTGADTRPGTTSTVIAVPGDVTRPADIERVFRQVEDTWGPPEVLVLSAGAGISAAVTGTTDDQWQRMLDLNLTAPFRIMRRALPAMKERGYGRIVVIASVVAKRGEPLVAAYTASKHGVLGLVRSAAAEYARTGVTINAVCPGYVDTPMTQHTIRDISERTGRSLDEARAALERKQPIRRLIQPREVATAVALCVDNGGITGQGINVDGGAEQS